MILNILLYISNFIVYIFLSIYSIQAKVYNIINPITKLPFIDINVYKAFNPSAFKYNNHIYIVHRLATGGFLNVYKVYEYFTNCSKYYPSRISIYNTNTNKAFELHTADIRSYNKYTHLTKHKSYKFLGYEDPRSIIINDYLYLIVSVFAEFEKFTQIGVFKIKLNKLLDSNYIIYSDNFCLLNPTYVNDCMQKNWMPFVYNNNLHFVYSTNPHKILKLLDDNGNIEIIHNNTYNIPKNLRGSSNAILYNNVYISITHHRYNMYYTHRFYTYDKNFKILNYTEEFIIFNNTLVFIKYHKLLNHLWNVQFVSGILLENDKLFVYYGINNEYSEYLTLNIDYIFKLLL